MSPEGRGRRRAAAVGAALSLAAVLAATLTPGPAGAVLPTGFCIVCGSTGGQDFFDNILLFLPLGLFLRASGVRVRWAFAACVALTVFVELMQRWVIPARDASVGDVVANSLGGLAGVLLADGWRTLVFPAPRLARRLAAAGAAGWLAVLAATAWALGPSPLPDRPRSTRFAPVDTRWSVFHGQVIDASLDGRRLAEGPLPLAAGAAAAGPGLRGGRAAVGDTLRLDVVVTNGNRRASFAPIVRVSAPAGPDDPHQDGEQVVAIGEDGCDVVYEVRLRASDLRLPSPTVTADRVFPCGDASDAARGVREGGTTYLAGALHDGRTLRVEAETFAPRSTDVMLETARELPLTPSLGWSFFFPWRFRFGVTPHAALSALWLGGLLLPVGWWAARGRSSGGSRWSAGTFAVVALLVVATGLGGITAVSRLAPPSPSDWIAALAGAAIGWLLSTRGR